MNVEATMQELRCPYCHAEPGQACTTADGYPMTSEHAARDTTLGPLTRRLLATSGRLADAQHR